MCSLKWSKIWEFILMSNIYVIFQKYDTLKISSLEWYIENFLFRVIYWKCSSQHEKVGIWFPYLHSMFEVSYSSYFVNNNLVGINKCVLSSIHCNIPSLYSLYGFFKKFVKHGYHLWISQCWIDMILIIGQDIYNSRIVHPSIFGKNNIFCVSLDY
jgi:hypothetical protein